MLVRQEEIDLIRGQGMIPGGILGVLLKVITGVPNVTSIHTDFDKIKKVKGKSDVFGSILLTKAAERFVIRRSSALFVLTSYLREMMLRRGADEANVYVVPNHIRTEEFSSLSDTERERKRDELGLDDRFTFVFVGRLVEAKDPMTLLEGFKRATQEQPGLQLVVVGDGPYRTEMERFAEANDIREDIIFTEFVDRSEIGEIMGAGDALVHPSLFEGFGFVYIEAQAVGLPIVTTDIPHVKSIVNAANGFVFPPGDKTELADQLVRVSTDDERREEMIHRGYETVKRFETARQHDRHEAALRAVAK